LSRIFPPVAVCPELHQAGQAALFPDHATMETKQTRCRIPLKLILLIACLYVLDQVTKWLVVLNYELPLYRVDHTPVISGNGLIGFDIVRVHNTGVAFGAGNGTAWAPFVFLGVQVVALVALVILYRRGFFFNRPLRLAWACIMTGVLGNMTDRLVQGFFLPGAEHLSFFENLTNGYVVDFLDFYFPWIPSEIFPEGYHWPAFNVADSCVCIAAAVFLLVAFFADRRPAEAPDKKSESH